MRDWMDFDDDTEDYYEDEMLEVLKKEQPDALITELDRVTEKVLNMNRRLQIWT